MLVTVLNCYQREEVKWKDMSGQIINLLLPLLAKQKVKTFKLVNNGFVYDFNWPQTIT